MPENNSSPDYSRTAYPLSLLLRIFIPFALGYFLSYLLRVINAIIAGNLSHDLDLSANDLGLLTSTYLIAFAAIQLPLGVLLDRFGPRRVEATLLLFATLGTAIFASATSLDMLILGRALIGLGVSACLMAAFKSFVQWFPLERLPLINGLHMTAGGLGILFASAPTEWLLQSIDWRGLFWLLSFLTLAVSAIIFFTVPDKPVLESHSTLREHIAGVAHIFSDRYFWRIIPLAVATQASALAMLGLWTGPWFRDVTLYDRSEVANALGLIALAMIAGYILIGFGTDRLMKRGYSCLNIAVVGMLVCTLALTALLFAPITLARLLWMLFGFFSTSSILIFAALSQHFTARLAGRANTAFNLLVFIFAFFIQWGIGAVLDAVPSESAGHYAAAGYRQAMFGLLGMQLSGLLWFGLFRPNLFSAQGSKD